MSNILTKDEIGALTGAVSEGKIETFTEEPRAASKEIIYIDLTNHKTLPSKLPGLDICNTRFLRKYRATLSTNLRKVVEIESIAVNHHNFAEFSKAISGPAWVHSFQMKPLSGNALLIMDSALATHFIEFMCGGKGIEVEYENREEFGQIEQYLLRDVVERMFRDLEEVWSSIIPIQIEALDIEFDPRFITSISMDEMLVCSYFSVNIEETKGILSIAIPYTVLEPIKQKLILTLSHDTEKSDTRWFPIIKATLNEVEADIQVVLGEKTVTAEELLKLKVGDVLQLNRFAGDSLNIMVEGVRKFKGLPGQYKGNKATQITEILYKDE
ncbi:MAG: flagellar motor switch protein FliM [bacterium]